MSMTLFISLHRTESNLFSLEGIKSFFSLGNTSIINFILLNVFSLSEPLLFAFRYPAFNLASDLFKIFLHLDI